MEGENSSRETSNIPATLSVAFLHSGGGDLIEVIANAGFEIAYLYDANDGVGGLQFDDIPPFDLVAAELAGSGEQRRQTLQLAILFIRARVPISFVLAGYYDDIIGFPDALDHRFDDPEYRVLMSASDDYHFVVGTLPGAEFAWPPEIVP